MNSMINDIDVVLKYWCSRTIHLNDTYWYHHWSSRSFAINFPLWLLSFEKEWSGNRDFWLVFLPFLGSHDLMTEHRRIAEISSQSLLIQYSIVFCFCFYINFEGSWYNDRVVITDDSSVILSCISSICLTE